MHVQRDQPGPGPEQAATTTMRAGSGSGAGCGPEIWLRGPVALPEEPPPSPGALPARRFSWVGVCGGAGVTTLSSVYGGHDCGRDWPEPGDPQSVLLVARTHATGLDAAMNAVSAFRRGEAPHGCDLDAVVLVADAPGRLPRPLAERVRALESVIDVYRVPWVAAWRLGDLDGQPPREADALRRLTGRAVR